MSEMYILSAGFIVTLFFIMFFSGNEVAFISVNRLGIELKKKQGKPGAIIISKLMEQPSNFLRTSIIGYSIFLSLYGLLFGEMIKLLAIAVHIENPYARLFVDIVFATLIILFFSEFLSKSIFRSMNDKLLNFFAPMSNFFCNLFNPLVLFFISFSENILKYLFNVRIKNADEPFFTVDIDRFLGQANEQDENNQELNKELLQNALSLPSLKIRQCLIPRTEIEAIDVLTDMNTVLKKFEETKLSKIIVYEGNIDSILGYIHQLDIFKKPSEIKSIILPIPVVPESMSATDLINKFTKERKSIAWVVDEFGGTAGIITMEDVLEEIFGEIKDEYDIEEFEEKKLSENEFIFSGRLELDYLNEKYGFDLPESESETLSGYIINEHQTIPKPKERIIIDKYEFDIIDVSDTRIEKIKMKLLR